MSQSTRLRPDAEAGQSHSAAHRDGSLAPNPPAGLVPKDHPTKRSRRGSGGVRVLAAVACLAWLAWPTEAFALQVTLNVDAVAGDNKINRSEHRNGIAVSGNTGTESGVTVEVTIGGTPLTSVTSAMNAMWSVNVERSADYITETSVELSVTATKIGFISATVTRTLPVDLTPPSVSYTAPSNLTVGVLITPIAPTTSDTDIVSYATSGGSLPLGLGLSGNTGIISGSPRTANTNTQTVGVLVTDDAGNVNRPQITFPAVELASGVMVSETELTVPEGGSASYTVRLLAQPTDDVTITVERASGDEDLTASPDTLTFTNSNWSVQQTVTVSAAEDDDGAAGTAQFGHKVISPGTVYHGVSTPGLRATEDDNDTIGVIVSPTALSVPEGGSATYTVRLGTKPPDDDVTVEATRDQLSDADLTVTSVTDMDADFNSVTLLFTDLNWHTEQTVTVSAAEDDDQVDGVAIFSHGVSGNDENYTNDEITIDPVTATEADNEKVVTVVIQTEVSAPVRGVFEVTIIFSEAVMGFERSEIAVTNGSVTDFSGSAPTYKAEITPSKSGEVIVEVGANVLEYGVGNGNIAGAPLVLEADLYPVVSYQEESYTAREGGETVTVTVKLSEGWDEELAIPIRVTRPQPESTEVDDYTVDGLEEWDAQEGTGKLTFSAGETEQTFTIAANDDGDGEDEELELGFGDLPTPVMAGAPVVATVTLKDKGLVVSYQEESYTAREGGETVTVTVKLSEGWDEELAIPIRVTRPQPESTEVDDYTVDGLEEWDAQEGTGKLTFSAGETEQTFTIAANDDGDGEDEELELGFGDLPTPVMAGAPVVATVTLKDKGLVVSYQEESYTALEGGEAATVTVKLSFGWDEELAISIRVTRPQPESTEVADYTVDGLEVWDAQEGTGKLTFPADETEQTFTIAANHDADGEDEELELGFGDLPTPVMAGAPAVATVTLEDKMVELTVSFGQAEYEIREGQEADIEVEVSPAADRRVEVLLVVALQGGATDEDYSGVPAKLVIEEGESQATIAIKVLADEVNDPGEGMVLSFGELPVGVISGDPSSTQVHFTQQRTAEQFSQTLEVMLAVLARSTAASAQSAIQGRFERHRQWSRLGSSGGVQGSGTSEAARVDVTEPTQGSRLRSFSLGSLGSTARSGQSHVGASPSYGKDLSGSVYGQDRLYGSGIGDAPLGPGSTDLSGTRDQGFSLAGTSFEMALGKQEQGNSTSWVPVLWGRGDLQHFNGDLDRLGMNYRGRLEAAHVGLDLYANDKMLAGLSFMRSWGDMDYTDDGIDGVLESRMNTVHPYLYWQPTERVSMWALGGMGWGEVEVKEPGRSHDFDADFRMLGGGVRAMLCRWPCNELALRADVFTAQLRTDATDDIAKVSGKAYRGRLMLEWVHDLPMSAGRSLGLQLEAGGRIDGGDADRGAGVETGLRLGYLDANHGLDVALHGRTLVVHESDYRDWGLGVQASWDPGEKQRGFRASVMSTWGRDGGGRTTLWDNADVVMRPTGMGAMSMASQYRMESEVAYAGLTAPGVPGLLTPYSRLRWAGPGRELALGTAWSLSAALPAMLELEAMRRETRTGPADLGMSLRVSIPLGGTRDVIPSRGHVSAQAPAPKLIPREVAESGADEQRASAAATQPPAEPVSAPQQDANPPPEPATPESASPASQPAQASAQPQGAAPAPTTTAPAKGHERVVNVQPTPQPRARTTPQPRSAASPTQTGELQAQVTLPQLDLRRQSPPAVTPPDAPAPTVLPSGGILVQVGAFRSAERAARSPTSYGNRVMPRSRSAATTITASSSGHSLTGATVPAPNHS